MFYGVKPTPNKEKGHMTTNISHRLTPCANHSTMATKFGKLRRPNPPNNKACLYCSMFS